MRPPGVVVLGADRLDAEILPDKVPGSLGVELVKRRFLGRVILIQPLLQRHAEAALDDRVWREPALFEIDGGGRPSVVEDERLHGVKDRAL